MKSFFDQAAHIIEASSKSSLGIIALSILAISFIAITFFKRDVVKVRLIIFFTIFTGLCLFVYAGLPIRTPNAPRIDQDDKCKKERTNETPRLNLSIVGHENASEQNLVNLFLGLTEEIRERAPGFRFHGIQLHNSEYYVEPDRYEQSTIATLRPIEYVRIKKQAHLIPILAVLKEQQTDPFYHGSFVTSNSAIVDLESSEIKTIYFVSKTSLSGYIAPLNELFRKKVIDAPTEEAVRRKGWSLKIVGSHQVVLDRIRSDKNSIGATGQYVSTDPQKTDIRVIYQYGRFPQDLLVISEDLREYQNQISAWFLSLSQDCRREIIFKSAARISGFTEITPQITNAYLEVEKMYNRTNR